jgi:hypothetical protein
MLLWKLLLKIRAVFTYKSEPELMMQEFWWGLNCLARKEIEPFG